MPLRKKTQKFSFTPIKILDILPPKLPFPIVIFQTNILLKYVKKKFCNVIGEKINRIPERSFINLGKKDEKKTDKKESAPVKKGTPTKKRSPSPAKKRSPSPKKSRYARFILLCFFYSSQFLQ